jgi:tRNA A-37 threonylcarbamoyl transferase component Bud32
MQAASEINPKWQQIAEALSDNKALSDDKALSRNETLAGWESLAGSAQARVFYHRDSRVYLKLFLEPRLRNRLKVRLFPSLSRHRKFVRNCKLLQERGFIAPNVVAAGEIAEPHRVGYVVTEAFEGMGLGSFVSQYLAASASDPRVRGWKRLVMSKLGEEVARLHNAGIVHGDLRPDNILLNCTSPKPQFCFIDNERNTSYRWRIPRRAIIKNLSQLNMIWSEDLSATYRLRVIKSYLAESALTWRDKDLISRIDRITRRRLQGKARGGYLRSDQRQMSRPDFDSLLTDID